ncbi:MAG TPA: hypothetical protein VIT38_08250 [Allosphingosinicella sp.]
MKAKTAALAALLALGGLPLLVAQAPAQPPQPAAAPRPLAFSRAERDTISALQAAVLGGDRVAQDTSLAAARTAAQSADARYAVAHYQFEIARSRGDGPMRTQAIDAMVASGLAQPSELPAFLTDQAERAYSAGDANRADQLMQRAVEIQPNNPVLLTDAAQMRARIGSAYARARRTQEAQGAYQDAARLLQHAIELREAGGVPAPESWYQRAIAIAYDNRLAPQTVSIGRALVAAYPTPMNWRDALLTYKSVAPVDPTLDFDIRRLMRASQALAGEGDYLDFATALNAAGQVGEAKAVLDEGVARGMLVATKPVVAQLSTAINRRLAADRASLVRIPAPAPGAAAGPVLRSAADRLFGYGRYAEAVPLYRTALQNGGEDPNLVNSRLGAALALAGQRAEAEVALRAVTGPRADLAGFWLAWLARRPVA